MADRKRVLIVATSTDRLDPAHRTGVWLEEFAIPFDALKRAGHEVVVASPAGGPVPIDPASRSESPSARNAAAEAALSDTLPVSEVRAGDFEAVYFPGGHGTMLDFAGPLVGNLATDFASLNKPVAAVCHGPAALVEARDAEGRPLVAGRRVAGFTNEEERASNLVDHVPFLLESRLRELGAHVETRPAWSSHVVVDRGLITGQNPQSSGAVAEALLDALAGR